MKTTTVLKLLEITCEYLRKMILKWQPTRDTFMDMMIVSNYLGRLPEKHLKGLLSLLLLNPQYRDGDQINYLQAGHVVNFVRDGQTKLKLTFEKKDFEFQLLLDVCGYKLKNVTDFQLPFSSSLSVNLCKRMCRLFPKLKKLILCGVDISDEAMAHLAALNLEQLDITNTDISDNGIFNICSANSNMKTTLRNLRIEDSKVTDYGCTQILKTMPLIENLDVISTWLTALQPSVVEKSIFNIKKLRFNGTPHQIEEQLEIAIKVCPNVLRIYLNTTELTLKILTLLSAFFKLTYLQVESLKTVGRWLKFERSDLSSFMLDLIFSNLTELSLFNIHEFWFQSGCFTALISVCPVLKILKLKNCDGFGCNIAKRMEIHETLQELYVGNCRKLHPTSLCYLLSIKSLKLCKIVVSNSYMQSHFYHFSLEMLLNEAFIKNVCLEIKFEDSYA